MKALKSSLANEILADPQARDELRRFLVARRPSAVSTDQPQAAEFRIRRGTSAATVKAVFVPKAKAA